MTATKPGTLTGAAPPLLLRDPNVVAPHSLPPPLPPSSPSFLPLTTAPSPPPPPLRRDPNVVAVKAFFGDDLKVNFCGKLASDAHQQVSVGSMCTAWL